MTGFEKYLQLKGQYKGIADDELKQYLTIVQVMAQEERQFHLHKTQLKEWLSNIEKTMKDKAKAVLEE